MGEGARFGDQRIGCELAATGSIAGPGESYDVWYADLQCNDDGVKTLCRRRSMIVEIQAMSMVLWLLSVCSMMLP